MGILNPVTNVKLVDRDKLQPNDYNPNKVLQQELDLLKKSIMSNGWTQPIVVRSDYTIIDGFHRWLVSGEEPLKSELDGKVPVVIVDHSDESENMYGTIQHNRARGTHLLGPMKGLVQRLLEQGKTTSEIAQSLGMTQEEVFRLSDFSREEFLNMIIKEQQYSKAQYIARY